MNALKKSGYPAEEYNEYTSPYTHNLTQVKSFSFSQGLQFTLLNQCLRIHFMEVINKPVTPLQINI